MESFHKETHSPAAATNLNKLSATERDGKKVHFSHHIMISSQMLNKNRYQYMLIACYLKPFEVPRLPKQSQSLNNVFHPVQSRHAATGHLTTTNVFSNEMLWLTQLLSFNEWIQKSDGWKVFMNWTIVKKVVTWRPSFQRKYSSNAQLNVLLVVPVLQGNRCVKGLMCARWIPTHESTHNNTFCKTPGWQHSRAVLILKREFVRCSISPLH